MAKLTLIGLAYSPWTQRARWALDHHGIGYAFKHYLPTAGEPMLRLRTGNFFGRVSVPVLLTPHGAITDSLSIARHADSVGGFSKLVDGQEEAVERWTAEADVAVTTTSAAPTTTVALYIQVGAFADPLNAQRVLDRLQSNGVPHVFSLASSGSGRALRRVRIGPIATVEEFDALAARLASLGYPEARLAND